jgi:hypothetical protein
MAHAPAIATGLAAGAILRTLQSHGFQIQNRPHRENNATERDAPLDIATHTILETRPPFQSRRRVPRRTQFPGPVVGSRTKPPLRRNQRMPKVGYESDSRTTKFRQKSIPHFAPRASRLWIRSVRIQAFVQNSLMLVWNGYALRIFGYPIPQLLNERNSLFLGKGIELGRDL